MQLQELRPSRFGGAPEPHRREAATGGGGLRRWMAEAGAWRLPLGEGDRWIGPSEVAGLPVEVGSGGTEDGSREVWAGLDGLEGAWDLCLICGGGPSP